MKRNMKIMLSALSVMLIMALAVTVLSFSLADDDNSVTQYANFDGANADSNTNIDNIIENSYATGEGANPVYNIVEIGSGASVGFDKFVSSNAFENYVINGNRTILDAMNAGQIKYQFFKASDVTDDNTAALAVISNADFVYVSNDTSAPYGSNNDMGEKLYDILHTYAVGDYKPLIIDKTADVGGTPSGPSGGTQNTYSMADLASYEFGLYGKYHYTFAWDTDKSKTAEEFFTRKNSLYLGINGSKKSSKWTEVSDSATPAPEEGTEKETFMMSEMLVITDGATPMYDLIYNGFTSVPTTLVDAADATISITGDVFDITNSAFYANGYNASYVRPTYTKVTKMSFDDAVADGVALDKYDMVIIEESCSSKSGEAAYNKFAAAMYGNVTMLYPSDMATTTVNNGGSSSDDYVNQQETNYAELFYMVATTDGQTRYDNILIPNAGQLNIIMNSNSADTCKIIADLINASAYRGNGGPKASSSKFTVLEIQPCYPIDEKLAAQLGDYYTVPSEVVNGKTKEELDEGTEYYAWELSKSKIAAAYGLTVDQVSLVQVSTEELASMKDDILGNYDLIYVGGNRTAFKDVGDQKGYSGINGSSGYGIIGSYVSSIENLEKIPVYTMYTHTGEPIIADLSNYGQSGQTAVGKIPTAYVEVIKNEGTPQQTIEYKKSFTLANGNDITYNVLQELKAYVKAGMPVVFSESASEAYNAVKTKGYRQNSIDPDCNMYKFMKYCGTTTTGNTAQFSNVLWYFDNENVIDSDNNGGDYGNTATGFVSVFADEQKSQLQALYTGSKKRPKLTLTGAPAAYNLYDTNSYIKDGKLNFAYKVSGVDKYTVELYVDDNGNSLFESTEVVATATAADVAKGILSFETADSFYGPVYWKLAVTGSNGLEASTTGLSYVSNGTAAKQDLRILQIMPGEQTAPGAAGSQDNGEKAQGRNALYFCTVCQQAYQKLEYNPSIDSGDLHNPITLYDGHYIDRPNGATNQNKSIYVGLHEHKFGIVPYDSNQEIDWAGVHTGKGADNWDENLADEIGDRYDFDLDIMLRSEFVDTSYDVADANNIDLLSEGEKKALEENNPYTKGTEDYTAYAEGTLNDKLTVKYEMIRDEYKEEYDELNGMIKYDEEDYEKAFADYPYKNSLKLEFTVFSEADKAKLGHTMSAVDAEIELRNAIRTLRDSISGGNTSADIYTELTRILEMRNYWDFYNVTYGTTGVYFCYSHSDNADPNVVKVKEAYAKWVALNDEKIVANNNYKTYARYASNEDWLLDCYDMVIIGPSNDFNNDDFTYSRATTNLTTGYSEASVPLYNGKLVFTVKSKHWTGNGYEINVPMNAKTVEATLVTPQNNWEGCASTSGYTNTIHSNDYGVTVTGTVMAPDYTIANGVNATDKYTPLANTEVTISVRTDGWQTISADQTVMTDANGQFTYTLSKDLISKNEVTVGTNYTITTTEKSDEPATQALADLKYYIQSGGNVLMFHDTMGGYRDAGPAYLTEAIRSLSGMDRYHMKINSSATTSVDDSYYMPYKTTSARGSEVYFMTDQSPAIYDDTNPAPEGYNKYTSWVADADSVLSGMSVGQGYYLSNVGYSDVGAVLQNTGGVHDKALPYKYAEILWSDAAVWADDIQAYAKTVKQGKFGSNKASKVNDGIVTMYPFTLSDQLNISATHAQPYALDIEDPDLTVWYAMAGGTGKKTGSSIYAATPNDGMDNYFIYTYKNFNYCGAGHTDVTGVLKDNNDERRLYINIICNSVRKSVAQPKIYVYDYLTEENKKFIETEEGYKVKVSETNEYPEFSLDIRLDQEADIRTVKIYYDLDYLSTTAKDKNAYIDNKYHILIADWTDDNISKGIIRDIFRYDSDLKFTADEYDVEGVASTRTSMLKLRPEYFDPYNGQYTYIVIEVEDTLGNITYQRIKIELRDKLFNLT